MPGAAPGVGAAGLGDSFYPGLGNGGYDVQHYDLSFDVHEVSSSELTASTVIDAIATSDLERLNLDFIGFTIDDVSVNDTEAKYTRAGPELTLEPTATLRTGDAFTLRINYHGTPVGIRSVAGHGQVGWLATGWNSIVLSEPDGAASLFPANDHPLDKASYTFRVSVPEPYTAVANGELESTVHEGSTARFVWQARNPMASYLATIGIAEFELQTRQGPGGLPIRNYFERGSNPERLAAFERQGEMLATFSELFGPYPFDVYGAAVLEAPGRIAFEAQTLSVFALRRFSDTSVRSNEFVIAHELAHQWFGDSVSVADFRDIWLNEGFARYAEALWLERGQERSLRSWFMQNYEDAQQQAAGLTPPGSPAPTDLFGSGVYLRGALALHALRLELGDDTFFSTLRAYTARFANANATTRDFENVAEEVSGRSLSDFFAAWLYGRDLPPLPEGLRQ